MYARLIGISVLTLFTGCQWWLEANLRIKTVNETPQETPEVAIQRAAEEVSKATGRGVDEIKGLSKEDLDKIAVDAKNSSLETRNSTEDSKSSKKQDEFIEEIQKSTKNLDLAFKSFLGAGYNNEVVTPILANIDTASKKLELASKIKKMEKESANKSIEEVKRAVRALGGDTDSCIRELDDRKYHANAVKEGLKECVKKLMDNAADLFLKGVRNELEDHLKNAPDKFKEGLNKLLGASYDLYNASLKVKYKD
ncbi:hypothetical protein [Borrelia sp. P9F1]|uniref:hypothetical protein n=1 Tax=Borrelia sp. P9F1 TaxID=3058374 RepID=UPI002649533C|nr:hypothetical protein [Borrelia sp. P9F1]WKC58513.1 hypothetical protein QYZ68_04660 [Borrelia sp. P9F1]